MIPRGARIQSSPAIAIKRRKRRRLRLIAFFTVLCIIVGSVVGFFYIPQLTITSVVVFGENTLSEKEIIDVANEVLVGSYGYIIPKRNIFVYPREKIVEALLKNQKIREVKVSFLDFHSIEITLRERLPEALWCGEELYEGGDNGRCYFLDEGGFVFSKAPDFSGHSFLRIIGGSVPIEKPLGGLVSDEQLYKTIMFFKDELEREVGNIDKIHFKPNGIIDLYFSVGGKVIVHERQDLGEAFRNLTALVGSPSFNGKDQTGALIVDYIDLQNPEKVFYKVKK